MARKVRVEFLDEEYWRELGVALRHRARLRDAKYAGRGSFGFDRVRRERLRGHDAEGRRGQ